MVYGCNGNLLSLPALMDFHCLQLLHLNPSHLVSLHTPHGYLFLTLKNNISTNQHKLLAQWDKIISGLMLKFSCLTFKSSWKYPLWLNPTKISLICQNITWAYQEAFVDFLVAPHNAAGSPILQCLLLLDPVYWNDCRGVLFKKFNQRVSI